MTEHRRAAGRTEVRVVDASKGVVEARVLTYRTVDDYGTVWEPGVFADSLSRRMPVIAWAHAWDEPIGRWTDVLRDDATALELRGKLDVSPDVPRARQALAQLASGTLTDWSVGFTRREWAQIEEPPEDLAGARERMLRADLDEVSTVLVGAVPGTSTLDVRRRLAGTGVRDVPLDAVVELGRRVTAGTLTLEDAEAALALLAAGTPLDLSTLGDTPPATPPVVDAPPAAPQVDPDVEAALAESLEALA